MALVETPAPALGTGAPDFALKDASGKRVTRDSARGPNGLVVAFICNHCPYVKAIARQLGRDIEALKAQGVGVVLVMSNDYAAYPDDAPAKMPAFARENGLDAPYVVDEDQSAAKAYGAVCTPDFFGYDRDLKLAYRGRLDPVTPSRPGKPGDPRELLEAMTLVARGKPAPEEQKASIGCSIKWRK